MVNKMDSYKYKYALHNKFVGLLKSHYSIDYNNLDKETRDKYTPEEYYLKMKKESPNYHTIYGPYSYI